MEFEIKEDEDDFSFTPTPYDTQVEAPVFEKNTTIIVESGPRYNWTGLGTISDERILQDYDISNSIMFEEERENEIEDTVESRDRESFRSSLKN